MFAVCSEDTAKYILRGTVDTLYIGTQAILTDGSVADSVEKAECLAAE